MERYLIENIGPNRDMVGYGFQWLEENGGGIAVTNQKRDMKETLGTLTDTQYKKAQSELANRGIRLETMQGRHSIGGNVFAIYPNEKMLDDLEEYERFEKLLVLGWSEKGYKAWRDEHSPTIIAGGNKPDEEMLDMMETVGIDTSSWR